MLIPEDARGRVRLTDLALDLAALSAGLAKSLPDGVIRALLDLVRSMNCYYSNLIEGHDTHPIDIERALRDDDSKDPKKRDLQLEARAHFNVQARIDAGGLDGRATPPTAFATCTGGSVRTCRTTCCGSPIPRLANGSRSSRASIAPPMYKSANTSPSVPGHCDLQI